MTTMTHSNPSPTTSQSAGAALPQNEVIRLSQVWKTYRMGDQDVNALAGVDLSIERGSFWAISGSSGSGKSTMLNLLGCLDRPSKGTYLLEGRDIAQTSDDELSDIRLKYLGFVFQNFHLIPQLTVEENIALPLFYQGIEGADASNKARELAERVGLGERLGHRPTELSGGQQQRVAIARALSNDPSVLLADEPTGNLDTATGDSIMALLCELHNQGKTIMMVTHEPDISAYAQYAMVMRDGKVESISENPPHPSRGGKHA
ncbi:MAG: ABC transporter ATP-binding protein [Phycisphaerales bacterium]|nr:ABC transporter ATP-binding protein [Phycisphaerales bacterium]